MNRPLSAVEESAAVALTQSVHRLSRRLRKRAALQLTPSQISALATVGRHDQIRVGELARLEQVGKSTITRLVSHLEQAGYLRRSVDPDDGRSYLVSLTDQAAEALRAAEARQHVYLTRQLDALDPADRDALFAALPAIEKLLEVKA